MLNVNIKYSGIYKINFPNGKSYIGLSNDIERRLREHNSDARRCDDELPVHEAIRKYGEAILFYNVEILEYVMPNDRKKLGEREIYWIDYYNTYKDKSKGYNLTPGGDGNGAGIYNSQAMLNEITINEVYDLLINHKELYIKDIAKEYGLSNVAISDINNGRRYYNPDFIYPLREDTKFKLGYKASRGIDSPLARLSEADVDKIYYLLVSSNISLQDIAKNFKVSYTVISYINRGLRYAREGQEYPVRKSLNGNSTFSIEQIQEIIKEIQNSSESLKAISKKYEVSYDTIRRINKGETYKMPHLHYPLR